MATRSPGLIVFDCDGVLVDSEVLAIETDVACLAECGFAVTAEEIAERYIGLSAATMVADLESRYGRALPADFTDTLRARIRLAFDSGLRPIAGIEALLDGLGIPVCVASFCAPFLST
jgi:beta-phosphoglucomutase-like phosphatase (HAD superfamily)